MANFTGISNQLEGIINTQLNAARGGQHVWEWYNALQRILSANYVAGTVKIYGPAEIADSDFVAVVSGAARLFGALIDNSISNEAVFVSALDGTASLTPGTEHITGALIYVPAATMHAAVWPGGIPYVTSGIAVYAGTGTSAGLEAGTGVTGTNPTGLLVYTQ